jgi:hypothetical protein
MLTDIGMMIIPKSKACARGEALDITRAKGYPRTKQITLTDEAKRMVVHTTERLWTSLRYCTKFIWLKRPSTMKVLTTNITNGTTKTSSR